MILYRGLRNQSEYELMYQKRSAGGKDADINATALTDDELKEFEGVGGQKYTSGECVTPQRDQVIITKFTEFTTNVTVARRFARRSGLCVRVEIDDRYVTILENDAQESGCVVRSEAPLISVKLI